MALEVNIKKRFSDFTLQVEFTNQSGCQGILGASGCGKSMTLKCIAGVEKPDEGRIVLNGKILFDSNKKINLPARERHVGYLFQNYALFPTMTVEDNLAIAIPGKKTDKTLRVEEQLERFQLKGLEKRYPHQISGGQQQRVALARMLLCKPEILMLDEPFTALDGFLKDTVQMEMLELIREFPGDVLMVSHSRDEIFKFCDSIVLLDKGSCILRGETSQIFTNPGWMEAARLTGCKNISGIRKLGDYELYAVDWGIKLETAEKIDEDIRYVGIRGHRMIPLRERKRENTMAIEGAGYSETPFEKQYLFRNAQAPGSGRMWWMEKKEDFSAGGADNLPPFMHFPKEHIMLLR